MFREHIERRNNLLFFESHDGLFAHQERRKRDGWVDAFNSSHGVVALVPDQHIDIDGFELGLMLLEQILYRLAVAAGLQGVKGDRYRFGIMIVGHAIPMVVV